MTILSEPIEQVYARCSRCRRTDLPTYDHNGERLCNPCFGGDWSHQ